MGGTHQKVSPLDAVGRKREAELNDDGRNELKEVRDGIAGDVQGLSDEDESRINDGALDLNETHILEAAAVSHIPVLEKLKHQSSAPIVRWERFLPLRTLKVLLVENDDSTRQVVRALLRNCCYEVTAVENGLEAWRVLQDLTNHIDLVLTEVVMPGGSGIGLLYKIMSHKTCKTIPVIMMSSNDSMGVVFKCLSKGAVDFLVKPIRKNELKNLWQHVWRRCHSSSGSGSGSESGIQGQKFTMSKSEDDSDNNTGSNDDEDDASIGLSVRDGSDNGSGTQSSCTKRAFEASNPQQMSPSGQTAGPHYSTCAQVIHTRPEAFCSKKEPMIAGMDWKEQKTITDDFMGADPKNESNQTDIVSTKLTGPSTEKSLEILPNNIDVVRHTNYSAVNEPCARAPDRLDSSSINTNQQLVFGPADTSKNFLKISDIKDNGSIELPSLEPSLKKLRSKSIPLNDERNVLKHSNLSAFSRYPASAASVQAPTIYGGNSVLDNSSEATPQNQGSNGSSTNNNDNGSTNINVVSKPAIFASALSSAFHRVEAQSSTVQPNMTEMIGQSRGTQKQVQVQHHHHHYHHYHHHVHALPPQPDPDGFSVENLKENVAYCNSSNVFTTPAEMNAADYSLNDSNSRSNHGSDGQNGCSTAINTVGGNVENVAVAAAEKNGVGGGNGSGNGAYQNRFTQREAALNKFRQKRKERNFGKKVRYQSRKRLAEQRPRVRGQFVRRIIRNDDHEEDCSHLMLD
ncbi:two-component response regulator-like PRR73 isoform X2 [Phalaenopsis equestris]|uniref:two-component response regulator-like PRR73 isoform X2 n=1 Tax=Phalaenopsis equestris TaxID=78828 RepID=UPI0009E59FEA|nr:two-component response regulator-like PRR73 isoform X2 [Phalaenopsis equestris]